jgi:thiol-disulfide isomerase/thioredoxin
MNPNNPKFFNEFSYVLFHLFFCYLQCGHCKKMAPDWETLAEEFAADKVGLVAEVDCTTAGKPLCDANGVRGFPTLKYGDPSALEDYKGSRALKDLSKFAKENLKPVCSIANIDLCDDEKKAQIQKYQAMAKEDLEKLVAEDEKALEEAEKNFSDAVAKLQADYQKISEEKDETLAKIKDSGLSLMKAVLSSKSKSDDKKDEL